jgi:hypothetical protein
MCGLEVHARKNVARSSSSLTQLLSMILGPFPIHRVICSRNTSILSKASNESESNSSRKVPFFCLQCVRGTKDTPIITYSHGWRDIMFMALGTYTSDMARESREQRTFRLIYQNCPGSMAGSNPRLLGFPLASRHPPFFLKESSRLIWPSHACVGSNHGRASCLSSGPNTCRCRG